MLQQLIKNKTVKDVKNSVIREQGIAEGSGNVTGYYIKFVGQYSIIRP